MAKVTIPRLSRYLSLGDLGSRVGGQKLLNDLELSHLHGVPVLLNLEVDAPLAHVWIQNHEFDDIHYTFEP